MGKVTGFMGFERLREDAEAPLLCVQHFNEFIVCLDDGAAKTQAARCMEF